MMSKTVNDSDSVGTIYREPAERYCEHNVNICIRLVRHTEALPMGLCYPNLTNLASNQANYCSSMEM